MSKAEIKWKVRGERITSGPGSTPGQGTMAGAFICIIPFTVHQGTVGMVSLPLDSEKSETHHSLRAIFLLWLCVFSFFPIIVAFFIFFSSFSVFFLCYNILCCDKYLLSSTWQQLQRFFHPISPSPMPFLTPWATVSLYDPWGLKLCQWYHLQIPQHL